MRRVVIFRAAVRVERLAIETDVFREALIDGHCRGVALLRRVVPGEQIRIELVPGAVRAGISGSAERAPVQGRGAERRGRADSGGPWTEIAASAVRDGEAVRAVGPLVCRSTERANSRLE